jgi:hypothetical protein
MKLMDAFSHAMEVDTPLVVQREAIAIAKKNGADFGFVLPLWATLPVVDGQFNDFKRPMMYATMPPAYGGAQIHGFDYVMGYYGYGGGRMGPWSYWRDPFVTAQPMGLFDISTFRTLFTMVSTMNIDMMFGGTDDQVSLKPEDWVLDYDKAAALGARENRENNDPIVRTWWEVTSFDARYPQAEENPPFPLPPSGNWNAKHWPDKPIPGMNPNPRDDPIRKNGWVDKPQGFTRATQAWAGADPREAVFYRVNRQRTPQYPELGIIAPHPPTNPDGTDWPYTDAEKHTYWTVSIYRFNGAELKTDQTLSRANMPPAGVQPLAPIFLDMATGDNLVNNIQQKFTFNGFAFMNGQVPDWGARFVNPNVTKDPVAFAQARVYNRYSWDLFTQHWRVKLMRTEASRWKPMIEALSQPLPPEAGDIATELTPDKVKSVSQVLEFYDDTFVNEVAN